MESTLFLACLILAGPSPLQDGAPALPAPVPFEPFLWGLELPVRDVAAAARAYAEGLGFEPGASGGESARLERDGLVLVLVRSDGPTAPAGSAGVSLNLAARRLEPALERALAAGFEVLGEPFESAIGRALTLRDPDGNRTHLIEPAGAGADPTGAEGLVVVPLGLDLERGADGEFVERLGLPALTRACESDARPFAKAGAAELVLQREATAPHPSGARGATLLLGCDDLVRARDPLVSAGLLDAGALPRATPCGRRFTLRAPSNVRLELVERSPAQLAFERLCALAGSWEGRSSAGWSSRIEIEVIARGSAVLERTNFEAHPGETMLTLFHRDGAELVLTHYCVAGNQPRLVATGLEEDRLHFTFRDATNLASRDQGHMDEAVFQLEGSDAFRSRWSFSQAGRTSWMEEIHYRRSGTER